jgi:hypothetical protein
MTFPRSRRSVPQSSTGRLEALCWLALKQRETIRPSATVMLYVTDIGVFGAILFLVGQPNQQIEAGKIVVGTDHGGNLLILKHC